LLEKYLNDNAKENANRLVGSFGWLKSTIAEEQMKKFALEKLYSKEIAEAHIKGFIHIHDLAHPIIGYCCGWSLMKLLKEGFNGPFTIVSSKPPKHLSSALGQLVNFFGVVQQEWAGAQAVNGFDTLLAPFIYYDKLSYKEVKQLIQEFIFNLNITYRWGMEAVFSNIMFDLTVPKDLENVPVIVGEVKDKCYGDFKEEMDIINRAFLEVMLEGDGSERPFTFPIPTYGITKNFEWDGIGNLLAKVTSKWGTPYFQNFIGSDLSQTDVRAMCCRLQLNLNELKKKTGGLFGYGDSTGSIGVVTINLSRLAYFAKTEDEFFELLEKYMDISKRSLEIKRKIVKKSIEKGLMPYSKIYLGHLKHHFSTIGLIGGNEMCLNLLNCSIAEEDGHGFAIKVLDFMRQKIKEYQRETGNLYNLEATPAEGCCYRLAKIDRMEFKDIITAGTKESPYYTNSTHLPVNIEIPLYQAIRHQEQLETKYTGGCVFHTFLAESPDVEALKILIRNICEKSKLPYISITPTYSVCKNHGYIKGRHFNCPKCNEECLVYSRVTGYLRPIQNYNPGKYEEFLQRREWRL